jgi:putative endonuclease
MNKEFNLSTGKKGEDLAEVFLKGLGYRIIARNLKFKCGEIDILAENRGVIVIVEVKTMTGYQFGSPVGLVNFKKQQKLKMLSKSILLRYPNSAIRIDVLGITLVNNVPKFEHLINAVW